jgi:hypothetical protein
MAVLVVNGFRMKEIIEAKVTPLFLTIIVCCFLFQ